jgi:hypothetical protein
MKRVTGSGVFVSYINKTRRSPPTPLRVSSKRATGSGAFGENVTDSDAFASRQYQ